MQSRPKVSPIHSMKAYKRNRGIAPLIRFSRNINASVFYDVSLVYMVTFSGLISDFGRCQVHSSRYLERERNVLYKEQTSHT